MRVLILLLGAVAACGQGGAQCPRDRDCRDRVCGLDPVCQTSCGDCAGGASCTWQGQCATPQCPDGKACGARVCGPDPVCQLACGDCGAGETCTPEGACIYPPCATSADCAADAVCVLGTCATPFDRIYRVTLVSAQVPATKPDGSSWDPFGGLPDPLVDVELDGVTYTSTVVSDTLAATWNAVLCEVPLHASSTVRVALWDYDPASSNDLVFDTGPQPLPAAWLHDGTVTVSGPDGVAQVVLRFELP
jgi:hypothetical protein